MKKIFFILTLSISIISCNFETDPYSSLSPILQSLNDDSSIEQLNNGILAIDSFAVKYPEHRFTDSLLYVKIQIQSVVDKKLFEQLKSHISDISYNSSLESIESAVNRIELFTSNYPQNPFADTLQQIRLNFKNIIEHKIFDAFFDKITQIVRANYPSYEDANKAFIEALDICNELEQQFTDESLIEKVQNLHITVNNKIQTLEEEISAYKYLTNNPSISLLEDFLYEYPDSPMREYLESQKDDLYLRDFLSGSSSSFNTISQLNQEVNGAKEYMNKLASYDNKLKIKEAIRELESNRRQVLEIELADELPNLLSAMESRARSEATSAHINAKIESCNPRGRNPDVTGYRSTIEMHYQIFTKSGYWLFNYKHRELSITVNGVINGNIHSGVSYRVTGSRVDHDKLLE